jgi:glutamine amidotransferase
VPDGAMVYFVHSYFPVPDDASVIAATTEHGIEFVSAIAVGNIFGTQFHPEKSSKIGLQILRNFVAL